MLSWKLQGGMEHWDCTDDLKLLETLSEDPEVEDEEEIDWAGLVQEWERYEVQLGYVSYHTGN